MTATKETMPGLPGLRRLSKKQCISVLPLSVGSHSLRNSTSQCWFALDLLCKADWFCYSFWVVGSSATEHP